MVGSINTNTNNQNINFNKNIIKQEKDNILEGTDYQESKI